MDEEKMKEFKRHIRSYIVLPIAIFAEIWYNVTNREVCFVNLGETYMSLPNDLSGSASKNRFRLELLWGISKMFEIYDEDDFTIVFDNVCDIEVHFKSELEFYQIKTHKVQKPYTLQRFQNLIKILTPLYSENCMY